MKHNLIYYIQEAGRYSILISEIKIFTPTVSFIDEKATHIINVYIVKNNKFSFN